jgi:hypothetical protein
MHQIAVARRTILRKKQCSEIGSVTHGDKFFANIQPPLAIALFQRRISQTCERIKTFRELMRAPIQPELVDYGGNSRTHHSIPIS